MKKFISLLCAVLLACAPVAYAVDADQGITKNGVSQGTLVSILKAHETLLNELAADHDVDNATVAELVTDHDADNDILNTYETLIEELAADKDDDVTALDTWETLIEELAADKDADVTALDTWETLIEELAADHDADNDVVADNTTAVNALIDVYNESVVQHSNLAISADAVKFKTTQEAFVVLKGFSITKSATDNLTFTAADTINTAAGAGDFWGVWRVEMGLDGTVYTNSPGADQVYVSEAAAIAAIPATTANRVSLGYITIEANTNASWTANTDDLTPSSDCQATSYVDVTEVSQRVAVSSAPAADLSATHPVDSVAVALSATHPVSTVAIDLSATAVSADLTADTVVGSGTVADPSISLTD